MEYDVGLGKHFTHARLGTSIRKEGVNLLYIAEAYHGLPAELGVISNKENLAGISNNRSPDTNLVIVEVEESTVPIDPAHTDDSKIDLELLYKVNRRFSCNTQIPATYHSTGDKDLKALVLAQDCCHIKVVRYDPESFVIQKRLGHLLCSGSDINERGSVVRDMPGQHSGNTALFRQVKYLTRGVCHIFYTGGQAGPPVVAAY